MRMEGPRTPQEVSFAKEAHRKRDVERSRQSERLEEQPTLVDVREHLVRRGLERLCPTIHDCKPANVEPVLTQDLETAREKRDEEQLLHIRRLLWTDSRQINTNDSPKRAESIAQRLLAEVLRKQQEIARYDADAVHDLKERIADIRNIIESLRRNRYGKDLEDETVLVESWFASALYTSQSPYEGIRKRALRELSDLRILRDEFYFRRCFPSWAKLRDSFIDQKSLEDKR